MKKKVTVSYAKFMYAIVIIILMIVIFRMGYVSLSTEVDGVNISYYAESRNTVTNVLLASRGNIFDADGNVLAQTINSYTLIAYLDESRTTDEDNPRHVVDVEYTAKVLAEILDMDEESLIETLSKDKYQVEITKDITELVKSKIDEYDLDGIDYVESNARYYPSGSFASYIIGYAKKDDDDKIVGEMGIEGYYNSLLTGTDGTTTYQKDAYGYIMPNTPSYTEDPVSGSDIYLTIDSSIQLILENAINKIEDSTGYEWAIIAVMEADTGAIVGSATTPSFNPNDLNTIGDNYLNPLVSYQFEPGSTMKTFSFAAAIEEDIYDGDATYTSGSIEVDDATISDFNKTGWGEITYDVGFAYSSNVAATNLALKLGVGTLTDYYTDLGFGSKTGIELSNEYSGSIDFLYNTELANAAFGQGISVTPIQMLQAYTAITNDGTVLKPYIVDKIVDENGNVTYESEVTELEKVYSSETVEYMKGLMSDAVYNSTSSYYIPDNVTIIGKTGTAQIASGGSYLTGTYDYIRSFVGIFPEDDPEYIFYIIVSKYEDSVSSLGEIATTAIEEIASYANITDEEDEYIINESIVLDNYISKKTDEVYEELDDAGLSVEVIGDGDYIIDQYPNKYTSLFEDDKIYLITNSTYYEMPDLTGFSSSEVKTICSFLGLEYKTSGYGYVVSQTIEAGTIITDETEKLEVELE